jgi:hypothetical protein
MIRKSGARFSDQIVRRQRTIRKSGYRFSDQIVRRQNA